MSEHRRHGRYDRVNLRKIAAFTGLLLTPAVLSGEAKPSTGSYYVEPARQVSIEKGVLKINHKPFFPIISWAQCASSVQQNLELGVNSFMDTSCDDEEVLAQAVGDQAYIIAPVKSNIETTSRLIGLNQPDEPDGYGIMPEALSRPDTSLPVFQTLTAGFSSTRDAPPAIGSKVPYAGYFKKANFFGFDDYYWNIYGCLIGDRNFATVYSLQREIAALATGRPTFQWIEVNQIASNNCPNQINPQRVKAETWLAIAGDARGIGYFTHKDPLAPNWQFFSVAPDVASEVRAQNDIIQQLSQPLLAPKIAVKQLALSPVKLTARRHKNNTYVIAVNASEQAARTSFKLKSIGNRVLRDLMDPNHQVTAYNGVARDKFDPLQVRIYKTQD